jgi:hypothetical protein
MSLGWITVPLLQVLSVAIVFIVLIAIIISAVLAAASGTSLVIDVSTIDAILVIYAVTAFILSIVFSLMLYRLVRRRNSHFTRQLFIYEDLARAAKEVAAKKGVDASSSLSNLERLSREAQVDERVRDPVLWSAILVFAAGATIPSVSAVSGFTGIGLVAVFAQYYVYYFLMKEWFVHERREDYFIDELSRLSTTTGLSLALPRRAQPIPNRSFAVYLILTIVTVGFFGVYWVYVLLSDPNQHMRYQSVAEDTMIGQLSAAIG